LDGAAVAALLRGSSPASLETAEILAPVAEALAQCQSPPTSIDEIRDLGPAADAAVSRWLELHGWRLLFSDDLDSVTLNERLDLQLKALLATRRINAEDRTGENELRQQVPADDRDRFDEVLSEARYGLRLRDDNVAVRWNWTAGLVRRSLLEVGRRLVDRRALSEATHVLELDASEVAALLTGDHGPTKDEVAQRVSERSVVIAANPPAELGPSAAPPPLSVFPAPLARATAAMLASVDAMEGEKSAKPLTGAGIGNTATRGRALVVDSANQAFDRIQQGDIIVTPFTGPSWNSLIPLANGIVVEEGGQMCHAAIVAREFGIPAIVGVNNATQLISDGSVIELDAAQGQINLMA
ncbi:MAG: PEP-utilizing enzyme, partial [Acidimicrobiales bacterium]